MIVIYTLRNTSLTVIEILNCITNFIEGFSMLSADIANSSNLIELSSIEQFKKYFKNQIRVRADEGELYAIERISKLINFKEVEKLSEEFKDAGYKVKVNTVENNFVISVFWN